MVAWKRFPIPEFNYEAFKDQPYEAPRVVSQADADAILKKYKSGDKSVYGAYVVTPRAELLDKFQVKGEFAHAVMCVVPKDAHLLGRSIAWKIQRALILDSLDPASAKVLYDWKTTRPMNTRLGPDDGVTLPGGLCYALTANKYADHWLGNRSIVDAAWKPGSGRNGFRILGSSDPDASDFHHTYLAFDWPA